MNDIEQQRQDLKDYILKEGEDLRKSLLDKLFNLNAFLSAAFLVLYQIEDNEAEIQILNIFPFCTALLILIYQLYELRILGHAYYKLDTWKKDDLKPIQDFKQKSFNIILLSIIFTIIEIIYLFKIILKF